MAANRGDKIPRNKIGSVAANPLIEEEQALQHSIEEAKVVAANTVVPITQASRVLPDSAAPKSVRGATTTIYFSDPDEYARFEAVMKTRRRSSKSSVMTQLLHAFMLALDSIPPDSDVSTVQLNHKIHV